MVVLAWLGAALLAATAVPVARVFVLGPESGRTQALAWPIAAFAPAVVGFALLGLASRTLLAQHRARWSGIATVSGWATVILAVLGVRLLAPGEWLVTALAGSVSAGMVVGAVVGWASGPAIPARVGPADPRRCSAGLAAALVAGALGGWLGRLPGRCRPGPRRGWRDRLGPAGHGGVRRRARAWPHPALLAQLWALRRRPAPVGRS